MASPWRGSPTAATVFLSGLKLSNRFHTHFLHETAQTRENKRARVTLTTTTTATNERLILIHPGWWPFIRVPAPGTEASWTAGLDDRWAQGTTQGRWVADGLGWTCSVTNGYFFFLLLSLSTFILFGKERESWLIHAGGRKKIWILHSLCHLHELNHLVSFGGDAQCFIFNFINA